MTEAGGAADAALAGRARALLGAAAESSIGYACAPPAEAVAAGRWRVGDATLPLSGAPTLVFVDLEPQANWGHRCCWLLLPAGDSPAQRIDATMPPFLKLDAPPVRLLWRGSAAPEWAVHLP
jgi:hypothetical protein